MAAAAGTVGAAAHPCDDLFDILKVAYDAAINNALDDDTIRDYDLARKNYFKTIEKAISTASKQKTTDGDNLAMQYRELINRHSGIYPEPNTLRSLVAISPPGTFPAAQVVVVSTTPGTTGVTTPTTALPMATGTATASTATTTATNAPLMSSLVKPSYSPPPPPVGRVQPPAQANQPAFPMTGQSPHATGANPAGIPAAQSGITQDVKTAIKASLDQSLQTGLSFQNTDDQVIIIGDAIESGLDKFPGGTRSSRHWPDLKGLGLSHVTRFSGDKKILSPRRYINWIESLGSVLSWSRHFCAYVLGLGLEVGSEAARWHETLVITQNPAIYDYHMLKPLFLKRFKQGCSYSERAAIFEILKYNPQKHSNLSNFLDECKLAVYQIESESHYSGNQTLTREQYRQELSLLTFLCGLPPSLRGEMAKMGLSDDATEDEIVDAIYKLTEADKARQTLPPNTSSSRFLSVTAVQDPEIAVDAVERRNRQAGSRPNQTGRSAQRGAARRQGACFHCGISGHFKASCRKWLATPEGQAAATRRNQTQGQNQQTSFRGQFSGQTNFAPNRARTNAVDQQSIPASPPNQGQFPAPPPSAPPGWIMGPNGTYPMPNEQTAIQTINAQPDIYSLLPPGNQLL